MKILKKLGQLTLRALSALLLLLITFELFFFKIVTPGGIITTLAITAITLAILIFLLSMRGKKYAGTWGAIRGSIGGLFQKKQAAPKTPARENVTMGPRVVGILLWGTIMVSFGALFPKAFAAWWDHQNIFWISQLVAILIILYFSQKYASWLSGIMITVIVIMLWNAISTTYWPEKTADESARVAPKPPTKTSVRTPDQYKVPAVAQGNGEWTVVKVPEGYTFTYTCSGWGWVKVYGNNIPPKECGPRNFRRGDWFGDNLRTLKDADGKRKLFVAFTSDEEKPINVKVTITRNY